MLMLMWTCAKLLKLRIFTGKKIKIPKIKVIHVFILIWKKFVFFLSREFFVYFGTFINYLNPS
jgi:hypothetical protein